MANNTIPEESKFRLKTLQDLQNAFNLFVKRDDEESIEIGRIGDVVRSLGLNPSDATLKKYSENLKNTGGGGITFDEFMIIYEAILKDRETIMDDCNVTVTTKNLIDVIRQYDKNATGKVSAAVLRHLLTTLGEKLTKNEVDALFFGIEDVEGNINYEEFIRMIMTDD